MDSPKRSRKRRRKPMLPFAVIFGRRDALRFLEAVEAMRRMALELVALKREMEELLQPMRAARAARKRPSKPLQATPAEVAAAMQGTANMLAEANGGKEARHE